MSVIITDTDTIEIDSDLDLLVELHIANFTDNNGLAHTVEYTSQGSNNNWCWVACAAMVLKYYGKNFQLCDIAKTGLPTFAENNQCCDIPSPCNVSLGEEQVTNLWVNCNITPSRNGQISPKDLITKIDDDRPVKIGIGQISPKDLITEIDNDRPVEIGISWGGTTVGHLFIVYGYIYYPTLRQIPKYANYPKIYYLIYDPFYPENKVKSFNQLQQGQIVDLDPNSNFFSWVSTWTNLSKPTPKVRTTTTRPNSRFRS